MKQKNILVIDDDEMNLQIAKMILERKLPCKVFCADNGLDGIEILHKHKVSLVLLDIMMPDFDGIETLQEIRGDEQIKNVPVMMLTATVETDTILQARALGVKDYIKKPFLPADLIGRVSKKLEEEHSEEILLFGDDAKTLERMQAVIEENFKHEAIIATSLDDAAKILREGEITLVVTCADMKFIDGFKLLNFMADEENFGNIPFAVSTPDNLRALIEKLNAPDEPAKPSKPVEFAETEEHEEVIAKEPKIVETPSEKKKIANVVTSFIGYKLDKRI